MKKLAGHRILALNRGEKEKFITVKVNAPEEDILRYLNKRVITGDNPNTTPILKEVTEDSYKRLIGPAIEREIRSDLTDKAEDGAIHVFGKESGAASHAASNCRESCAGLGPCIPYRLQAGCCRCNRKGSGYHSGISYSAYHREEDPCCQGHGRENDR